MDRPKTIDEQAEILAASQCGVVTRKQLLASGFSPGSIERRVRNRRFHLLHRGVYRVGPLQVARAAEMAAVLLGGPGSAVSHWSALQLWGLLPADKEQDLHVTVAGLAKRRLAGVVFHRTEALSPDELGIVDGVPVTSVVRSLTDSATVLGRRELERAITAGERDGLITESDLLGMLDRYTRRPGIAILRTLVEGEATREFTRSEAERRCIALLEKAQIPRPQVNVAVGPYELDFYWPKEGVALEVDGYMYHGRRTRFEADRRRDNQLRSRGIDVIRVTWRQLTRESFATAVLIGQALALARLSRNRAGG